MPKTVRDRVPRMFVVLRLYNTELKGQMKNLTEKVSKTLRRKMNYLTAAGKKIPKIVLGFV